jgi:hypothetical protein
MPKMPLSELKALLDAERNDAVAATRASKLSVERSDAMDYYLGDMAKDMPAADGRSRAVSTDVADTIEGLMPSLMEIFCGGDEVVRFEAVGPNDTAAAEQETDYVNHVFMQANPGFLILYTFIKDALLSKVGVVKTGWEVSEKEQKETYYDISNDGFGQLLRDPEIEIVEHSQHSVYPNGAPPQPAAGAESGATALSFPPNDPSSMLHDVTVVRRKTYGCAKVWAVPPEEFGLSKKARNITDATYCFHEVVKTQSELIEDGYEPAQVEDLPSYVFPSTSSVETFSRDTVNESAEAVGDEGVNDAARQLKITEHYIQLDYEGDGKARLYKITTGGDQNEILRRANTDETGKRGPYKDDIEPQDMMPFAAMTPVIVTHRFFGRSLADLVMDIQRIKTALLRGLLDNAYLSNNPRVEVSESHITDTTLDDLLVSRPGGVVRTKAPGGINWQVVPNIAANVYPLLEYQDQQREWRTGVSRAGQGLDANALQNQTATAANQLFTAAQARMKLIARIFAETGIRDLFYLLHAQIRKHGSKPETVRLRNNWVTVDPRNWRARNDMTVEVGLGTGGKAEQMVNMQLIATGQEKAIPLGIVTPQNIYETAKEMTKLAGHKNTSRFFTPPDQQRANIPIPPPPDPKHAEAQAQTQIAAAKAQADQQLQQQKTQAQLSADSQKANLDAQLKAEQLQAEITLKRQQMAAEIELKREQMAAELALDRERLHMEHDRELHKITLAHQASLAANGNGSVGSAVRLGGELG